MCRSVVATIVFFATGVVTNGLVHKAELPHIDSGSWSLLPLSGVILLAEAIPMVVELGLAVYGVRGSNPSLTCTGANVQTLGLSDWIRCTKAFSHSTNP